MLIPSRSVTLPLCALWQLFALCVRHQFRKVGLHSWQEVCVREDVVGVALDVCQALCQHDLVFTHLLALRLWGLLQNASPEALLGVQTCRRMEACAQGILGEMLEC